MVLSNVNSGAFEVYDIANNQITGAASLGQVGWTGSLAVSPPIRRPAPWGVRTARPLSSYRQWQVSPAAQPMH